MTKAILTLVTLLAVALFNSSALFPTEGNVASASGGAHNGTVNLSFGAFDHGEGNITGQATFIDDATRQKVTVDVECVKVTGSQADVGGTVSKSSNPSFTVGSAVHFIVDDQGEGTGIIDYFTPLAVGTCDSGNTSAVIASDRGNIQVRFYAPDKDCTKCPVGTHCAGNGECVGGGGGGGGTACPPGSRECCGTCVPFEQECPVACSPR